METQQMMELLSRINASMKKQMQEMMASMKSNQDLLARLEARIETNREKDQENLKEIREEIKSGQAEMRFSVCVMRSELEETIHHRMKAVLQPIRPELNETTACNRATETEPDPRMMQSVEEHQEAPKEDTVVMPVRGPRKRHRVCNLAVERRQKREKRAQGNCEYRRKSAVACRKVSRCAEVAWRKRNLVRRIETQRNYGLQKRLTVTGRKKTSRATVAWRSENVVRKDCTRDQEKRGTPK
jgi:hypothetical protein